MLQYLSGVEFTPAAISVGFTIISLDNLWKLYWLSHCVALSDSCLQYYLQGV